MGLYKIYFQIFKKKIQFLDSIRSRDRKITDPATGEFITIRWQKIIMRPVMIEQFFKAFPAIDINDHYRQGMLELERHWLTQSWWIRIFTTMFGLIIVNCYFAALTEHEDNAQLQEQINMPDFLQFCGKLAYKMIFNPLREQADRQRRQRAADNAAHGAAGEQVRLRKYFL